MLYRVCNSAVSMSIDRTFQRALPCTLLSLAITICEKFRSKPPSAKNHRRIVDVGRYRETNSQRLNQRLPCYNVVYLVRTSFPWILGSTDSSTFTGLPLCFTLHSLGQRPNRYMEWVYTKAINFESQLWVGWG